MKTKIFTIPIIEINLIDVTSPQDVLEICRRLNIRDYVYEFRQNNNTMKYGSSCGQMPGERIYRQVCNIPDAWDQTFYSSSGKEIETVCESYEDRYKEKVQKDLVKVVIYNMTNYNFDFPWNKKLDIERYEAELINNHFKRHGFNPVGNIKDEASKLEVDATPIDRLKDLFHI